MKGTLKPPAIPEKDQSPLVKQLLAFIEQQAHIIQEQAEKIQKLSDEIARLKNQPPKPDIKPSSLGKKKPQTSKNKRNKRPVPKKDQRQPTFGNRGTIAANSRDEQRKIIKYGHLLANILIFMNVHDHSKVMNELIQEGHVITKEQAACLAPYRKSNINRFGAYFLDELRDAISIDYRLPVVSLSN